MPGHALVVYLACATALVAASPARAATVTLEGALAGPSARSARVLGVACSGATTIARRAGAGRFRLVLRTPVAGTSLQVLGAGNDYRGPLVLARRGRRGVLALGSVRGGRHSLGTVTLRRGYATLRRAVPRALRLGPAGVRLDRGGRPLGATSLGLVRAGSRSSARCGAARAAQEGGSAQQGADPDADGIPNAFDVDDNGNATLDAVDSDAQGAPPGPSFFWFSDMFVSAADTLNAHVLPSPAPYDQAVKNYLRTNLGMPIGWAGAGADAASALIVDCGTIAFCASAGATATLRFPPALDGRNWVEATRTAASGGNPTIPFTARDVGGRGWEVTVKPTLPDTIGELQPGRTLLVTVRAASGDTTTPVPVPAFFLTQPAVVALRVGAGAEEAVTYPVGTGGRELDRLPVSSLVLQLTWVRPQRPPVTDAEKAAFQDRLVNLPDYFGLRYYATVGVGTFTQGQHQCQADALSTSDPNLAPQGASSPEGYDFLVDRLTDGAAGQRLTATFDLAKCRKPSNFPNGGETVEQTLARLPPEDRRVRLDFGASDLDSNNGIQSWFFQAP